MNNKTSSNFSLRKLILAALVTGPMAILPAPLWALPGITTGTGGNLATSNGVTVSQVGANTLNITAPDKVVLSWVNFGSGADTIGAADTLTYTLPSAAGSVLNLVTGGGNTRIDGSIVSNGNVYVMNQNGIVIGNTAVINVGGFFASAVNEPLPAANFANTGTLSYNGTTGGTVSFDGVAANGGRAQIQAVGSGNNIVLAGANVNVGSGVFYGNVNARTIGGNINLASGGAVAVNQVNGVGGNVTLTSNGGNVVLSGVGTTQTVPTAVVGGASGTLSLAPVANDGTGYAPNSQIALTIAAPSILQNTSRTTTGRAAAGYASTDAAGRITGFTITDAGYGYVAAPTVSIDAPTAFTTSIAGNLSINTSATAANGSVSQNNAVSAGAATITTGTAGSALAPNSVTLGNVNFTSLTLPYAGTVSVSDTTGGLALGNSKVVTDTAAAYTVSAGGSGSITMASSSARVEVVPFTSTNPTPTLALSASTGSVTFAGTGALSFGTLSSSSVSGTATVTGTGDVSVPSFGGRNLSVTTTGGALTVGNLTNTSGSATLTSTGNLTLGSFNTTGVVKATSSAGTLTAAAAATTANQAASGSEFRSSGDLSILSLASPGATIASSAGSVSIPNGFAGAGSITAANDVSIGMPNTGLSKGVFAVSSSTVVTTNAAGTASNNNSAGGRITAGSVSNSGLGYTPNSTVGISIGAPAANNTNAAGYATINASGQISGIVITEPGSGYTSAPTAASLTISSVPTLAVVANGALSIAATTGSVSISAPVVSTSTSALSITSGQSLSVPAITAPTLSLSSTTGGITQTGAVVSSGTATLTAATDITLSNVANDFGTVVVKNAPAGATVGDANAIVVGNGTDAKGNLTVNAGLGVTGVANNGALTVTPGTAAPLGGAIVAASSGSVTGVTVNGVLAGYTPSQTNIAVIFSAPPADVTPTNITSLSTGQTNQGSLLSPVGTFQGVVLPRALGNGYRPSTVVPITITPNVGDINATPPTGWEAVVNGNGQISSIRMSATGTVGANMTLAPTVSFPTPASQPGYSAPSTAQGYATANASGVISSITVTDAGTGYFGSYIPRITNIAAPAGITAATATAVSNGANAVTEVNFTGGANYNVAPVVSGGGITYSVTLTNGAVTAVVPMATGGVSLGAATTDVINVAGDLAVSTAGPAGTVTSTLAKYSEITTGANNIRVNGKVTTNTTGANVVLGAPTPLGSSTAFFFGSINGNVGGGNLTAFENTSINLGTITAGSVNATSIAGDIVNSGAVVTAGDVSLSANSFFSPGTVTLDNAANAIAGNVNLLNASSATVRNSVNTTIVSSAGATGRGLTGNVSATAAAGRNITFNTAGGGDYSTVAFNVSGAGNVTVNDPNGVTISNAVSAGTGTVTVNANNGPLVLGSGISLLSTGAVSFNSAGTTANITDSAPGMVVFGPAAFTSANGISVTRSGHSFGPVSLTAGGAAATNANIAFTEAGTLNLRSVSINGATAEEVGGSVVLTSISGDIIQGAGTTGIQLPVLPSTDPLVPAVARTLSLTAAGGVTLTAAATNAITVPVSINAAGNSSVSQNSSLVLGDVAVRAGTFAASTAGALAGTITQATGSKITAFGDTSFNTQGGAITVANAGNNFGGLTLNSANGGAGANISLTEGGSSRLVAVNTGAGNLAVVSENGSILGGATPVITVGGTTSLSAPGGITLNNGNSLNGAVTLNTAASATVQNGVTTILGAGSVVGGSLTIRNTGGNITDAAAGNVKVTGAVFLDAGGGDIGITGSGNQFGAVQFRGVTVNIAQDTSLNLAGGSVANGNASLTSLANIQTSGVGTSVFSGTSVFNGSLQLNAGGNITVGNNIFVANGLTFRALGAVDLSAISQSGNLNGRAPVDLGRSSYKAPSP